ncbi:hypothetical protein BDZ94DRAFT_1151884, partial [Collybia nuda]
DFGGLAPTTPLVRVKPRNLARTAKPNSRADPGPSTKPAGGLPKAGRKNARVTVNNSDIEEITVVENTVNGVDPFQTQLRAKKPPSRTEAPPANGKQKAKGKAKAVPKATRQASMEFETIDDEEEDRIEILEAKDVDGRARPETPPGPPNKRRKKNTDPTQMNDDDGTSRLAEQLHRAQTQIDDLSNQLENLFKLRTTEAEDALHQQEIKYEASMQAQQLLIEKLNSQLAQKEPLTSTGKASILNLITREAADEEKRALQREVERLKKAIEDNQRLIQEKDEIIVTMGQTVSPDHSKLLLEQDLRYELKVEVNKAKDLAVKLGQHPPGTARFKAGPVVPDPKHGEVIKFYEDLTNLLITNVKPQTSMSEDEWILSCIFTFVDTEDASNDIRKSLNFTLRTCDEPAAGSEESVKSIHYVPLELDKEPEEYVTDLGFLGLPFTFPRDQLPLFLRTIYNNMGDATREKTEDDSDNDDSVQFVERRSPHPQID